MVNKTLTIWHKASGKALLTSDEAWRIAANIAKLPGLTAEKTKSRIQGPADALMFLTAKLESKALKEGAVTFSSDQRQVHHGDVGLGSSTASPTILPARRQYP
jgi:hypothetical protein